MGRGTRVAPRGSGEGVHMDGAGPVEGAASFPHDPETLACASRRAEALPYASLLRTRPGPLPGQGDPSGVRPAPTRGLRGKVGRERARHPGVPSESVIPQRPQAPAGGGCATRLLEPDEMEKAVVCSSAPENRNRTQVRAVILQGSGEWKRRACRR